MLITNAKVIDDEKKTQELEANKGGGKVVQDKGVTWDAPYPEGVKKHKIHTPEKPDSSKGTEGTEGRKGKATVHAEVKDEKNNG